MTIERRLTNKILFFLFTCLLILIIVVPIKSFAEENNHLTLRVGYWPAYGASTDENGKISGYSVEYIEKIAEYNHWDIEFISCDWDQGIEMLKTGEIDVFGPLQKTPEREELFDFPSIRAGYEYGALYVNKENNNIFHNDLQSLDGKILGSVTDNYHLKPLQNFCQKNGISFTIKVINDSDQLYSKLKSGEIDLVASGSMLMPPNSKVVLQFSTEEFYFPTTKGNKIVLEGFNRALEEIQRDDVYYDANLYNKYYAKMSIKNKAFTAKERAYVNENPTLKVGYVEEFRPFTYYDKQTNSAAGISIDLFNEIENYSRLKAEFIPIKGFNQAQEDIKNGLYDVVLGVANTETFAKENNFILTSPFQKAKLSFIVKHDYDYDNNEVVIAIPKDWIDINCQIRENYPNLRIKNYPTSKDCLDAMINSEANLSIKNTLVEDSDLKPSQYSNLYINDMRYGDLNLSIALPNTCKDELLSVLNKSIDAISTDVTDMVISKHTIGIPYEPSFIEKLKNNSPIFMSLAIVVFALLYLFSVYSRRRLNKLAYYDPLTGEMNINKFKMESQKNLSSSHKPCTVMVVDISKFKSINDLYGYELGDEVLKVMSKCLSSSIIPGTLLCRGNADKFNLFFEHSDKEIIEHVFNKFIKSLDAPVKEILPNCKIVVNAGICIGSPKEKNINSMIDRANIATKKVKDSHISTLAYYNQSMYDKLNEETEIQNNMFYALENKEFVVYLQPKIELKSREMVGAEALVRWVRPDKGFVMPNDFIPLFEKNGFILELDFYILEQICQLQERRQKEDKPLFTISVNLSRRHLMIPDTAKTLYSVVSKHNIPPSLIELELTESAFDNRNVPDIQKLFDDLHSYGFTVSVDDFGAGYSSLSLLKDLPIDVLKIDKSFFNCNKTCDISKMISLLEGVISLSRKLNIKTVSEGIETESQVDLLSRLGCDLVQGYYFSRPMPAADLEKQIEEKIKW